MEGDEPQARVRKVTTRSSGLAADDSSCTTFNRHETYVEFIRSSPIAGSFSSVKTYKHWANEEGLSTFTAELYRDTPAALTVEIGSFARDSKKAIRKGTRFTWFTAFNALFEVSLRRGHVSSHHVDDDDPSGTHDKHQKIVITLSANSYASRVAFSGADFGFSRSWSRIDEICRGR